MANLFKTIAEIKLVVPTIHAQLNKNDLDAYLDDAADTFLTPYISQAYYDGLVTRYNADETTAADDAVLTHIQKASAWFGVYAAMPFLNINIAGSGLSQNRNDETQPLRMWEYNQARAEAIRKADLALDRALAVMEATPANYTDWTGSAAYTIRKGLLINSVDKLEQYGPKINQSRRTWLKLQPWLDLVETKHVSSTIGATLFSDLKAAWVAGTTDSDDDALLEYVYPVIAYMALYEGAQQLQLNITDHGVMVASTNDGQTTLDHGNDSKQYHQWRKEIGDTGQFYRTQLVKFLDDNASATKYISYYNDVKKYKVDNAAGKIPDNSGSTASVIM